MRDRRGFLAILVAGASAALIGGCASTAPAFQGDALMSSLTGSGLSTNQAAGGLGAMMSLAESKLGPADYKSLTKLMPSAEKYVKVAQDAGVLTTPVKDIQGLNSAFSKLGLDPTQARGLLSSASDYAYKQGGDAGRGLVTRALNL
jgi:hypothetical protein